MGELDRMARAFCFTLNNYSEEEYEAVKTFPYRYIVVGKEVGESGTPHLQGYWYFANAKSIKQLIKHFPRAHFEIAKGTAKQNQDYCKKSNFYFEDGTPPASPAEKGAKGAEAIAERWVLAKSGQFELLPPEQIKIYQYIYSKNLGAVDRAELDNEWIFGPSGCGKSSYVRKQHMVFYSKPMSRWWDGYNGEEVVVLDDFDPSHGPYLGYFLKIWADHYAFNAEVKGGMLRIRPKKIIITSQYALEDCFTELQTIEALNRRFKQILLNKK